MKNTKYIIGLFVIISLIFLVGCAQTANVVKENPDKVVKIGIIASLTGDAAHLGEALNNAKTIAENGLKNTNTYFKYEFIVEDDSLQNTRTVTAFQKLTAVDGINALVSLSSGTGNAVAPLAEQSKIITCWIASDPNVVNGRKYVFKNFVTPEKEAEKYVEEVDHRDFKTVGMIVVNQQGFLATASELEKRLGNRVIVKEIVDPASKDFRTSIIKIKQKNPDTLYIGLLPGQITPVMQQLEELYYKGDVSSIESFEFDQTAIPYLEGKWYINTAEEQGKFKEEYEKEFLTKPLIYSGNTYDCINLIVKAYENAKSTNPEKISEELHKIKDYDGALGKLYIDQGNSVQSQAVVKEIRNGTFVVVR